MKPVDLINLDAALALGKDRNLPWRPSRDRPQHEARLTPLSYERKKLREAASQALGWPLEQIGDNQIRAAIRTQIMRRYPGVTLPPVDTVLTAQGELLLIEYRRSTP